ncbi:MAG: hypothetical protein KGM43_07375, partial [Planctomycetota bacterium]|nr:hypothetical protein [Planctomycetota bacterium]
MKPASNWRRAATAASALILTSWLAPATPAEEKKGEAPKLPAAVRATLDTYYPGAKIRGADKETEGGVTFFEVEMTFRGTNIDVNVSPQGAILVTETEIDALPVTVVNSLLATHGRAKVVKAESIVKEGGLTYEVLLESKGKRAEVVFTPGGKVVEDGSKESNQKEAGKTPADRPAPAVKTVSLEKAEGKKHAAHAKKDKDDDEDDDKPAAHHHDAHEKAHAKKDKDDDEDDDDKPAAHHHDAHEKAHAKKDKDDDEDDDKPAAHHHEAHGKAHAKKDKDDDEDDDDKPAAHHHEAHGKAHA